MSHENLLDAAQHAEREDALLYERVGEHACAMGAMRTLAVLRTWFADRAQMYPVATGHRVAFEEVADMLDQMREVVEQAGADQLTCAALSGEFSPRDNGRSELGDGT